ncbi:MAG TPA: DUF2269 family protein [Mycobacteriales bacterium]|jgi:hypothetical protein
MTLRNVLLTLHILIAILTLGWLLIDAMVLPRAIRNGQAAVIRFAEGIAGKLGPAAGVVFLLGLWLVGRDGDDGIEFSDAWVSASMLLFILAMVNGAVLMRRVIERAASKIEGGVDAADDARTLSMLAGVNGVLLTVIVYLMVAKPGGY